jgi:hypothetical protein
MEANRRPRVIKTTAVIAGVNGKLHYFQEADRLPDALRGQMERAFQGGLTVSIVLADEGGQAYLKNNHPAPPAARPAQTPVAAPLNRALLWRRMLWESLGGVMVAWLLYLFAAGR